jgi:hypothetical protein
MYASPIGEEASTDFFFLSIDTMQVPRIIAKTEAYSLSVYFALPIKMDPIITGTIFPDFANVTTGNETLFASESVVNAFARTYYQK